MKKVKDAPYSPRKRWFSEKQLEAAVKRMKTGARERIALAEETEGKSELDLTRIYGEKVSIHVVRGVDLRATLQEKALECHKFAKWTAFVNRLGTLVHIVPQEGDFHVRIPLYFRTRSLSDRAIEMLVQQYAQGRLK